MYTDNSTVIYPLKSAARDGVTNTENAFIKALFLDCKIYGANPNKYYRVAWVGNNDVTYGHKYSILITEYDKSTYATSSTSSKRELNPLNWNSMIDYIPENASGINTVNILSMDGSICITLTLDYSAFTSYSMGTYFDFQASSFIIDPICYMTNYETNILNLDLTDTTSPIANVFSNKFKFDFRKDHANQLFGFWQTWTRTNTTPIPAIFANTDSGVVNFGDSTDLIGPYVAQAVNNGDNGSVCFTGGQHGNGGDNVGTGVTPTAETKSILFYVDGTQKITSGTYYGKQIDIYITNYIMSYNTLTTSRYTHSETVHYTIRNGKIDVENVIKPFEHIRIYTYYGMQIHNKHFDHITFLGDTNNSRTIIGDTTQGSPKSAGMYNTMRLDNNSNTDIVEMHMETIGLGDRQFVDDSLSLAFCTGALAKTYFRICGFYGNTKAFDMYPNKTYFWKGYYWFKSRY